jgi:hypothetical protein
MAAGNAAFFTGLPAEGSAPRPADASRIDHIRRIAAPGHIGIFRTRTGISRQLNLLGNKRRRGQELRPARNDYRVELPCKLSKIVESVCEVLGCGAIFIERVKQKVCVAQEKVSLNYSRIRSQSLHRI